MSGERTKKCLARAVIAALVVLAAAVVFVIVREHYTLPVGRPFIGFVISDAGLALQLGALVLGVLAVNALPPALAPRVLAIEGALCLLGFGLTGLACGAVLIAWCVAIDARSLGRLRFALAAAIIVGVEATALSSDLAPAGLLFAMLFVPRLLVLGYDRWQHGDQPLGDVWPYLLAPPFVVFPPYLTFLPLYGGFASKIAPELTRARAIRIARHIALALAFGGMRIALGELGEPVPYGKLLRLVLEFAAFAHLVLPLLLLHGIDLAPPLDRPLLSTRYVDLWQRLSIHQKDAQVFLFYTPALLRLRRINRYAAIALATLWALVVGSTVLHLAARYCFEPDPELVGRMLLANVIMGAVLAYDLCLDEYRRRTRAGPRVGWRLALGWVITMTLAALIDLL